MGARTTAAGGRPSVHLVRQRAQRGRDRDLVGGLGVEAVQVFRQPGEFLGRVLAGLV